MIKEFKNLNKNEQDLLLKAPVYISMLTAIKDGEIAGEEKEEAVKLTHLRTFTADPLLQEYYKEVEKNFEENLERILKSLPEGMDEKQEALREKLAQLNDILARIDKKFAITLKKSLESYGRHVSHAHDNVFEYFFIPLNVKGLTE